MATLSTWYHGQYSTWNRTRRLRVAPFLARTDTNTSRTATAMASRTQGSAVVTNMGGVANGNKDKKQEALFGPNIGVVSSGPAWTEIKEKKVMAEELTPEVVQNWIARSKESTQPTTTLQALVNLKRPTLRLTPLALAPADDPSQVDSQHHGLEFEYDCDAPKCGIYVHVLLSPDHPHAEPTASQSRILVFETVVEGGFGKILKLEEDATLELGRFENHPHQPVAAPAAPPPLVDGEVQPAAEPANAGNPESTVPTPSAVSDRRRRFSTFHFRKRTRSHSVAGPALAVVDAEVTSNGKAKDTGRDEQGEEGVKVTIRLAALDEQGTELALPNEQVTYLHVVRFGPAPADGLEDTRTWVVKVVKREATIGPHTFQLHEIYGLSSTATQPVTPMPTNLAETPAADVHTYPPITTTTSATHHVTEDEPSSECLLCLSCPREVVLLPCRHLVACKECALNMVEFGAGGNIVQPEIDVVTPGGDIETGAAAVVTADGTSAAAVTTPVTPMSVTTPTAMAARRKRKAKGWFCPVCRQPYTSLLRITTASPVKDPDNRPSVSEEPAPPLEIVPPSSGNITTLSPSATRGGLSVLRPAFLRNFSRSSNPSDLERGMAIA